jgi:two-component system phosphate regulon response regulator PhoB
MPGKPERNAAHNEGNHMTAKKTILIVDDEPDTLTFFSSVLEDAGYATLMAENVGQAMEKVKESRPDLITLDISMPETSGVRCYRQLRENEELKSIPVVIITGISEDFRTFISSRRHVPPPDGYLTKPVEEEQLLKVVQDLVPAS